jgi:hypothetical protein
MYFLIKSFKKYILKNIFSSQFQTPLVSESTLGAHNVTILEPSDHYVKLQSEGQDFISVLISFKSSTLDPLSSLSLSLSLSLSERNHFAARSSLRLPQPVNLKETKESTRFQYLK